MIKLTSLPQYKRNALRAKEIVSTLVKYGLANWVKENDPEFIKELFISDDGEKIAGLPVETCIKKALTELGATFIKIGQMLSTRPDLVGMDLARELSELQSEAPPDKPSVVKKTLEEEFNVPIDKLFLEFDDLPLGSASIGQVHRAVLHSGEVVIVKIQHDGIKELIETDFDIMSGLIDLAVKYEPGLKVFQPKAIISEFKQVILKELDFRRERRNLEKFAKNFADDETVHFPKTYNELSSKKVLTMEMLKGYSISNLERMKSDGFDLRELAVRGAKVTLKMIFRDGFYHSDPHPGNIWILEDGRLGILDAGMVGRVDDQLKEEIEIILLAAVNGDAERVTEYIFRLGSIPTGTDRQSLKIEISDFLADVIDVPLHELDIGATLSGVIAIIRKFNIVLPSKLSLLIRALIMLENTSRNLDRNFSLAELLKPFLTETTLSRYSPEKFFSSLKRSYRDWHRLLDMLPNNLTDILLLIRDGKLDVHLEHHDLGRIVNRLIYGILIASLFLGSCMVLSQQIQPVYKGVSIIGACGCIWALFLGYWLHSDIKQSETKK
ncbi:MAG: AarF/ABC1/UbiB kinase family protein [Candidatus Rifleibacteriota bacterium]